MPQRLIIVACDFFCAHGHDVPTEDWYKDYRKEWEVVESVIKSEFHNSPLYPHGYIDSEFNTGCDRADCTVCAWRLQDYSKNRGLTMPEVNAADVLKTLLERTDTTKFAGRLIVDIWQPIVAPATTAHCNGAYVSLADDSKTIKPLPADGGMADTVRRLSKIALYEKHCDAEAFFRGL